MKARFVATAIALTFSATIVAPVQAMTVISSSGKLESSDPMTNGRLFRDGVVSSWSTVKPFPGVTTSGASFAYDLVSVDFAAMARRTSSTGYPIRTKLQAALIPPHIAIHSIRLISLLTISATPVPLQIPDSPKAMKLK